jgi:hypothetical protein
MHPTRGTHLFCCTSKQSPLSSYLVTSKQVLVMLITKNPKENTAKTYSQKSQALILDLLLTSFVTLGKSLNLSVPFLSAFLSVRYR